MIKRKKNVGLEVREKWMTNKENKMREITEREMREKGRRMEEE